MDSVYARLKRHEVCKAAFTYCLIKGQHSAALWNKKDELCCKISACLVITTIYEDILNTIQVITIDVTLLAFVVLPVQRKNEDHETEPKAGDMNFQ